MKLVIFGLTLSSSWGNGHATLWRGLLRALIAAGHRVTFFERDVPYYAAHRDLHELPGGVLVLYPDWSAGEARARAALDHADVAIVTSYAADGDVAAGLVLRSRAMKVFYDLDTPVTLASLDAGRRVPYLPSDGLRGFDLVLSFVGGAVLERLRTQLGARRVAPLYGSADPEVHAPAPPAPEDERAALSYLGTYSDDRQAALDALFLGPARLLATRRFLLGGALYPELTRLPPNVSHVQQVAPPDHPHFYAASSVTLHVTRQVIAEVGYCPSGRLFEAAACGVPILSDAWEGLDQFFAPGSEVLVAKSTEEALRELARPASELLEIAARARARVLREHTAERRAAELLSILSDKAAARRAVPAIESR